MSWKRPSQTEMTNKSLTFIFFGQKEYKLLLIKSIIYIWREWFSEMLINFINPHIHWPIYSHIHWPIYSHIHWPIYPHIHWPIYSHIHWPMYPHIHWPIYPHIHWPIYPHMHIPDCSLVVQYRFSFFILEQ